MAVTRNPVFDNWNIRYLESIVGACTICMSDGPGVDMGPADSLCATCIKNAWAALNGAPATAAPTVSAGPDARTLDEIKAGVEPSAAAALRDVSNAKDPSADIPYCGICETAFPNKSALGSHNYQQRNKKHAGLVPTAVTPPDAPQEQAAI